MKKCRIIETGSRHVGMGPIVPQVKSGALVRTATNQPWWMVLRLQLVGHQMSWRTDMLDDGLQLEARPDLFRLQVDNSIEAILARSRRKELMARVRCLGRVLVTGTGRGR